MAQRLSLSTAPVGNLGMTPQYNTNANTAFAVGVNMQDFHVGGGQSGDEMFIEVCNIDTTPHQLVGSFYQGAITSPDDLFYQAIPAQSGWIKIVGGDVLPQGAHLAFGVPGAADLGKLNIRGFVNRFVQDSRKLPLSGASGNPYNKNIKIAGTSVATATLLHTAYGGTDKMDEVYVNLTNTSTAPVLVTLCVGGTSAACQTLLTIPGQSGWTAALDGHSLNNGLVISAFAATANVINARGKVNRVTI